MSVTKVAGTFAAIFVAATTAFAQTGASMTVTGCLMGEQEFRKTHNLTKGSFGGLGLGNEFVLIEGSCSDANGKAYRLTGKAERDLKPFVGKQIEVTGRWDHARDAKTAAGETNAKLPPEIRIASFHEAGTASAPAVAAAPAAPAAPEQTVASNNETTRTKPLPHTASNLPLVGLIGLASLTAFFGLRLFSTRSA